MYRVLLPDYFDDIKANDEEEAVDKFINELRDLLNNKTNKEVKKSLSIIAWWED